MRHFAWCFCTVLFAFLLIGCAQPALKNSDSKDPNAYWSGRLSLRTEGVSVQTFSANFELTGNAAAGDFSLFSPFGNTLVVLKWDSNSAEMLSNGEIKKFNSLEQLATQITSTPLPIASLFEWLRGLTAPSSDWVADLEFISGGRLTVRNFRAEPAVELKLIFEPAPAIR